MGYSVKWVADNLGITRDMLRYYEKEKLLPANENRHYRNYSDEDIERIWEKFYKVDKARTREYGGNGIGLSIVKAILDNYKASYGARNLKDGVDFWFDMPVHEV